MPTIGDYIRGDARVATGMGFAVMLLGVLAIMTPFASGLVATSLLSILVVAAGLAMTVFAFKASSFGKGLLQFFFGGITIVCGVLMFITPMTSMVTLTGVLMVYFVVDGVFSIVTGIKNRSERGWGWVIVSGIASIVLAVLLYREWPDSGAYAVGLLVGIRLIFSGWTVAMLGLVGDATVDALEEAGMQAKQA